MPSPAHDPFDALGDPNRRAILALLGTHERSVQQLADALPISRPAVSRHLRVLKEAGLVTDRPEGTRRLYGLHDRGVDAVRAYVEQVWGEAAARSVPVAERRRRASSRWWTMRPEPRDGATRARCSCTSRRAVSSTSGTLRFDRSDATEVEVSFGPAGDGTEVTIVHRGWERLGAVAERRERNRRGWEGVTEHYRAACSEAA